MLRGLRSKEFAGNKKFCPSAAKAALLSHYLRHDYPSRLRVKSRALTKIGFATPGSRDLSCVVTTDQSWSMKRKYEEDHSALGMECCERLVMMILKISRSAASSSRNVPPTEELSGLSVASSRSVS